MKRSRQPQGGGKKDKEPDELFLEMLVIGAGILLLFFIAFKPAWDLYHA